MPSNSKETDREALRREMQEHQKAAHTCRKKARDFKDPHKKREFYIAADEHSRKAMNIMRALNHA